MLKPSDQERECAYIKAHILELLSVSGAFKMFPAFASFYGNKELLYAYIDQLKYENVIREVTIDCADHNRVFTLAD